jgi:hypothetical protein
VDRGSWNLRGHPAAAPAAIPRPGRSRRLPATIRASTHGLQGDLEGHGLDRAHGRAAGAHGAGSGQAGGAGDHGHFEVRTSRSGRPAGREGLGRAKSIFLIAVILISYRHLHGPTALGPGAPPNSRRVHCARAVRQKAASSLGGAGASACTWCTRCGGAQLHWLRLRGEKRDKGTGRRLAWCRAGCVAHRELANART